MSDFVTMISRIADELARSDLTTFIGREINTAIKHYESMRVWWTEEKEFDFGDTADGARYYDLPADFIRVDSIKVNYNDAYYDLSPRIWEYVEHHDNQVTPTKGVPKHYALYDDTMRLFPVPDGTYPLLLSYLKRLPALSGDTDTNGWMTFGEELIRARANAAVQIKYLRRPVAIAESAQMSAMGKTTLSYCEQIALDSLREEVSHRLSTGRLRTMETKPSHLWAKEAK